MMDPHAFLALSQAQRDAAYDNTKAVTTSAALLQDFEARSAQMAQQPGAQLDLRYGPAERQQFDFFADPNVTGRDTVLFIHGGYWQMRHKNTFRFVVEGALQQGHSAALIGYTLAPQANLSTIASQVLSGISAVSAHARSQGHSGRIRLCGWSAGGHLTALSMAHPAVVAGLGISGIYELEPIRHTYLNAALQLSAAEAFALSPIHQKQALAKPFTTAYGTGELPQLQAQSQAYVRKHSGTLLPIASANHFSILDALAKADGALLQALLAND